MIMIAEMQQRPLSNSGIAVSTIAMGCWPIAGMTSADVNDSDSINTLRAAFEHGVNFFDTAYCYGMDGESERLIAAALTSKSQNDLARRDELVIATKCGIRWDRNGQQVTDGSPQKLKQEIDISLKRLETDRVELLYLHTPDPNTPIAESAGALLEIMQSGKTRTVGLSNCRLSTLQEFHAVCPVSAIQPPFNMLQPQQLMELAPWCIENNISIFCFWPLLKGLLAGKLSRDHQFDENDGRKKYPAFQGGEYQRSQDLVDTLRTIAARLDRSVASVVLNWTIQQPGITAALCGAKRPDQIIDNASAMGWQLPRSEMDEIELAIEKRGSIPCRQAV